MSLPPSRLLLLAAVAGSVLSLSAQPAAPASAPVPAGAVAPIPAPRARVSPHETIRAVVDGKSVVVVYGRPYSKAPRGNEIRKIWGVTVPYNEVWRLGSDEATLLITEAALDFGGTTVPAGAYSLHMLPVENGTSKLIINKHIGQWGIPYTQAAEELARVDLSKAPLSSPLDQLTLALDANGTLRIQWENLQFSAKFSVKK